MMRERPKHAPLTQFPVIDDALVVGGSMVRELVTTAGQTPFYAYDGSAIARRIDKLRNALPETLSLHYAIKANPMPGVVQLLAERTDGLDIASAGEMALALQTGIAPSDISFTGPGKSDDELGQAIEAGITLNTESAGELERTFRIADAQGQTPNIAVRINPDFVLKSSGMQMGGGPRAFGVDAEKAPTLLRQIADNGAHFRGFQIYSGSQNLQAEQLNAAFAATFELAYRLADKAPGDLETLNIGGGFGIPYFPGELPLDVERVGAGLATELSRCHARHGTVEVILELGRYLVGEAGIYVCEVIDRKVSRDQVYLVTNGGLHHHLAASGNFGQVIRKNYPLVNAHRVAGGRRERVNVVGPLCTPLDILGENVELGATDVGDLIVVLQSGAYGYTASPLGFLSHPLPAQILV
jgi:diaminopimelate decarboxylase